MHKRTEIYPMDKNKEVSTTEKEDEKKKNYGTEKHVWKHGIKVPVSAAKPEDHLLLLGAEFGFLRADKRKTWYFYTADRFKQSSHIYT